MPPARTSPASDLGRTSRHSPRSCRRQGGSTSPSANDSTSSIRAFLHHGIHGGAHRLKGSEIGVWHGEVDVVRRKQFVDQIGSVLRPVVTLFMNRLTAASFYSVPMPISPPPHVAAASERACASAFCQGSRRTLMDHGSRGLGRVETYRRKDSWSCPSSSQAPVRSVGVADPTARELDRSGARKMAAIAPNAVTNQPARRGTAGWRNYIQPRFGNWPVASITAAEVSSWVGSLVARGLAPSTATHAWPRSALSSRSPWLTVACNTTSRRQLASQPAPVRAGKARRSSSMSCWP